MNGSINEKERIIKQREIYIYKITRNKERKKDIKQREIYIQKRERKKDIRIIENERYTQ